MRGAYHWGDPGHRLRGWKGISLIQFRADVNCDVDMNMGRTGPSRISPIWLKPEAVVQTTGFGHAGTPELGQGQTGNCQLLVKFFKYLKLLPS